MIHHSKDGARVYRRLERSSDQNLGEDGLKGRIDNWDSQECLGAFTNGSLERIQSVVDDFFKEPNITHSKRGFVLDRNVYAMME